MAVYIGAGHRALRFMNMTLIPLLLPAGLSCNIQMIMSLPFGTILIGAFTYASFEELR